eukprot:6418149-Prymnesium_polylepis.1
MQRGSSEVCAMCSGCDEDRRDMLIAAWLIRIERICSPQAIQLAALGIVGHQVEETSQVTLSTGTWSPHCAMAAIAYISMARRRISTVSESSFHHL